MIYPEEFQNLLESFEKIPGIGEKSAERFVYSINQMSTEDIDDFSQNLLNFKKKIQKCSNCGHLSNSDLCNVCMDKNRNNKVICVLEDSKNVFAFEKTGKYNGLYHVLGGLISPINGVNPEDLNINYLIDKRINNVEEIIIALNPTVEGEMTSLYLQKILEKKNIKVSRLSYGVTLGSDLEYLDPLAIVRALDDRKFLS